MVYLLARRFSLTACPYMRLVFAFCSLSTRPVHSVSIRHMSVLLRYCFPSFPYRVPHFFNPGIPHIFSFHSSWVCLTDPCCPCLVLGWGRGCDQHLLESKVFHDRLVVPVGVSSALLAFKRPLRSNAAYAFFSFFFFSLRTAVTRGERKKSHRVCFQVARTVFQHFSKVR